MQIKATPPLPPAGKTPGTAAGASDPQDAKLKAACTDMEAVFLNMLLAQMRRTVPKSTIMGEGGNQEEIMRSLLDSEMTKNMAKAGGIGLADMLYRQLSQSTHKTVDKGQAP